jgi:DNA-binding XRE family transcriptional regulator
VSAANIGEALLAKRKERRLDQGRASAEIGVSPSTYRSYERNTQRPSVNVFPPLAKFLGLEIEEFLPLYAATVIFALRPALERELAGLGMSSTSNGDTPVREESSANGTGEVDQDSDSDDADDDDDDDEGGEDIHETDEAPFATADTTTIDQRAVDGVTEIEVAEVVVVEDDDEDDDDEDEDEEEDEDDDEDEPLTEDDWLVDEPIEAAPSQLSTASTFFEKPAKQKKKKKKKKR